MIQLEPRLALRRLVITARGAKVYDQEFHDGINIIRGRNSSGKSTIADFIFFALGGEFNRWKEEAERCQEVFAEVEINSQRITLRRLVTPKLRQPVYIFWDTLEMANKSAVEGWQLYPFARLEPKESFSQLLFRALGLPEVKTETDNNLTMHQLLRLMYVDQVSSIESLFRTEDFDHPLIRQAIGDVMLGVYDDSIYADEAARRNKEKEVEQLKREIESLSRLFTDIDQELDLSTITNEIESTNDQLDKLNVALTEDSRRFSESGIIDDSREVEQKRNRLIELRKKFDECLNDKSRQQLEIDDSQYFLDSLSNRLKALGESLVTSEAFGNVEFTHCPKCLAEMSPLPEEHIGHCNLCRSPLPEDGRKSQTLRMQQELSLQIKESSALLTDKLTTLKEIEARIPALAQELQNAERDMNQLLEEVISPREAARDSIVLKKGQLEGRLDFLHQQARSASLLVSLQDRKILVESDISRLLIAITSKRKTKDKRLFEAHEQLERFTRTLLHADLSRENIFKTAKDVRIDFRNDSYSVDGRNQFSASSMTYLRNSIHFAVLFASLELDFMRYPRFLLCDNIEDKGMEEVRSKNFQKIVVQISESIDVAHQIIFTTSMVDESLDNDKYCIGPAYNDTHHTLEFPIV